MFIDETFMWLYAAHKAGMMFIAPAIICTVCGIAGVGGWIEKSHAIFLKFGTASLSIASVCIGLYAASPGKDELKAYAAYCIGKQVMDSNAAKVTMDAALKLLNEGGNRD